MYEENIYRLMAVSLEAFRQGGYVLGSVFTICAIVAFVITLAVIARLCYDEVRGEREKRRSHPGEIPEQLQPGGLTLFGMELHADHLAASADRSEARRVFRLAHHARRIGRFDVV